MNGKLRLVWALLGLIAISALSGCVAGGPVHDTLIVQIQNDLEHVDNRFGGYSSAYDNIINAQWQGYLTMLAPGSTVNWMPGVADLTISSDGTTYTYTIREDAKFHDGSSVRARDVRYSFENGLMTFLGLPNMTWGQIYEQFYFNTTFPESDPEGNGRVLTMNGAWWPDAAYMFDASGQWNLFTLIPEGQAGGYDEELLWNGAAQGGLAVFNEHPNSTGPYKFVSHTENTEVLLERFDDWFGWGETLTDVLGNEWTYPSVDQAFKYVRFKIIPEAAMAVVALQSGTVDLTTSQIDSGEVFDFIKESEGFTAVAQDSLTIWGLYLNINGDWPQWAGGPGNYPFSELWMRRALTHGINRTNLVENVYGGLASENDEFYPDWALVDYPDIDTSGFYDMSTNITKANEILDAAGYPTGRFPGEPGNRFGYGPIFNDTNSANEGHHFRMFADASVPFKVAQAIAAKKDLEEIGVYVDLDMLDRTSYLSELRAIEWGGTGGGNIGEVYNHTLMLANQPDPDFAGPQWDLYFGGAGYYYELPEQFPHFASSAFYFWYGGDGGVVNIDFETAYAKMVGGNGYLDAPSWDDGTYWMPGAPTDVDFPYVPQWLNSNTQFVEGATEAGEIWTNEMLSYIPAVWGVDTYAFSTHLQNFNADRGQLFQAWYMYWE